MILELSVKQVRRYAIPLIRQTMGEEVGKGAEAAWANDPDGGETNLWGVFDMTGIVGVCGLGSAISERKVWLGYLAVRADGRGRGLGRRLLCYAEEMAQAQGYSEIFVETYAHPTFEAACKLYETNGYTQVGSLAEYLEDGSDILYYRKVL